MSFQSLHTAIFGADTDLEKVTREYPYFSPAHFFLLKETAPGTGAYATAAAKTALHFSNPYLLKQQLNSTENSAPTNPGGLVYEHIPEPHPDQLPELNDEPITEAVANAIASANPETEHTEHNFEHRVEVMDEPVVEEVEETQNVEAAIIAPPETVKENVLAENTREENNPPLLFEPLHTTDYFASQGIKLSEVIQPGDKMGRQMKSFTEWLKTMKKVHPDGLKDKGDGFIDPSVQKLAEKSNKEEEVLTESMAEVYLQQGKTNKAKEIYEKLSLLNPSKNAYFAAKLKEIQ